MEKTIRDVRAGGLCVTLTPESVDDVFGPASAAAIARADSVEVRLDHLKEPRQALGVRWDRLELPVIATCRGKAQGGEFQGSVEEELAILESAARNGARFVDIDYRFARPVADAEVIASYHNFVETPVDLDAIADKVFGSPGTIGKIATLANSWSDNRRLFETLGRSRSKPAIVIGMGEIGEFTRLAGTARGSFLTFAAGTAAAAPGQLSVDAMLDVYNFRRIGSTTRILGILGMPVGHSLSPVIHNRAFRETGLDFAYLKFPAPDVGDFMQNARSLGIHGFSVTIPHKIAVMPYLAGLQPAANAVGAVNTVSAADGFWIGDNTDVEGVRRALASAGFEPGGKTVVILGRGGGAKAAAAAVSGAASVRTLSRQDMEDMRNYSCDLLINATPLGMYPNTDASPVRGSIAASMVFDMVYNPHTTKLLQQAANEGKTIIRGSRMFLAQAARQFEIWTGRTAPPEIYESEASLL